MFPESENSTVVPRQSGTDTVYARLCLLFAFLFCQAIPVVKHPLGGYLVILGLFVSGFVLLGMKKVKIPPICVLSALSALVIGSALLLTDTRFLIKLSWAYCILSYCYFLYAAMGNRIEEGISDYVYIDFIKILFVLPFTALIAIYPALFNKQTRKNSLLILKILVGICIAVIPTSLVFLCLSYDNGFMKLLDDIFTFEFSDVIHTIISLYFTLPLAMYGFGLYASADKKTLHEKMSAENCRSALEKTKILPQLTAVVAVLPILFLYVVFFISQWKYYVSGFTGVLPEEFSYAEYARDGFFQLCAVSVINLIMIVSVAFFIRRGKNGGSLILKIVATVFCLCTLVLISTAVAKLVMYIESYGLTPKRIYAMWLMALIAIVFVIIAAGQFLRKWKVVAASFAVAVVMFAGLSVCNVNALCARYNVDRYLSGSLETVDVRALEDLGDSAVPSMVRLYNEMEPEKKPGPRKQLERILDTKAELAKTEKFSLFGFSIPSTMAKSALKDYKNP